MAAAFGLKADNVRVVAPHTGGGFGAKAFICPLQVGLLRCLLSKEAGGSGCWSWRR